MSNGLKQSEEHSESRSQPGTKLESIWDVTRAIKDGDKEYMNRLGVIADLLSDSNANLEKMIGIGTLLENHLREIQVGISVLVERTK